MQSPPNHTTSNFISWGDWVAIYAIDPIGNPNEYLPGCIWQLPSGKDSFHTTISNPECRNEIMKLLTFSVDKLQICVWSYERYWRGNEKGPCHCCEINFQDCLDCFNCFNNNFEDVDKKLSVCLLSDKMKASQGNENLSCYRCLNMKKPNLNC